MGLLREAGQPDPDGWILDLACGAGRHLRAMARAGFAAVGVDLSVDLLAEARRRAGGAHPQLVRADMRRLPFRSGAFSTLTNFFTSFGYFASREEDGLAADEMARVLESGGLFLLDYLNADRVRATLVPEDEREVRGHTVRQRRWVEGGAVMKRIEIRAPGKATRVHHERVRLYGADELGALLEQHGLRTRRRFGDYDGSAYGEASPRLILLGRRA